MDLAPWRSQLAGALHRNRSLPYARYLQLATVRSDGKPANRTVVFRGFLPETNQLQFVSDRRSDKINQIQTCPWAEACWYFPETREQFRLMGILSVIAADYPDPELLQARQTAWQELSEAARLQFTWPPPGQTRSPDPDAFNSPAPDPVIPLDGFCLLLLDPMHVDHLQLRGNPQNRWLFQRDQAGECSTQAINP